MATTQTQPAAAHKTLEVRKEVFDLDSKGTVTITKVGDLEPITSADDFVSRLNSDSQLILRFMNVAYEAYAQEQLEGNPNVPWQLVDEDKDGNEVLAPFTGTPLSAEKTKGLAATVINFAKLLFGYQKVMVVGDVEANRKAKAAAKESALAAILSNPASVEQLRK